MYITASSNLCLSVLPVSVQGLSNDASKAGFPAFKVKEPEDSLAANRYLPESE
jgi:hypothetical protein